jgi:hypothetical protein
MGTLLTVMARDAATGEEFEAFQWTRGAQAGVDRAYADAETHGRPISHAWIGRTLIDGCEPTPGEIDDVYTARRILRAKPGGATHKRLLHEATPRVLAMVEALPPLLDRFCIAFAERRAIETARVAYLHPEGKAEEAAGGVCDHCGGGNQHGETCRRCGAIMPAE